MAIYSLKQRIFIVKRYYQNGNSIEKVKNDFVIEYNHNQPTDANIVEFVELFENFGSVIINSNVDIKFKVIYDPDNEEGDVEEASHNGFVTNPEDVPITYEEDLSKHIEEPIYSDSNNSNLNEYSYCKSKSEVNDTIEILKINSSVCNIHTVGKSNFETNDSKEERVKKDILLNSVAYTEGKLDIGNQSTSNICHTLSTKYKLINNKSTHTGVNIYKCPICNKIFATSTTLNKHIRIHDGDKSEQRVVPKIEFKKLIDTIHNGLIPFECTLCDNKYYTKTNLMNHQEVHTRENSHCMETFTNERTCHRNERTHTRESYPCTICGKSFNQISRLKAPKANVHTHGRLW